MPGWYSVGTVTVTNGSAVVTGAGTDFVNNVNARDALLVAGGNPLQIASVQSATQLTLAKAWLGASNGGQAYEVQPTVGFYVDVALRVLNMLTPFQLVLDGIGQGLVGAGTVAAPNLRRLTDQDTGVAWIAENVLGLVTGGVVRLTADTSRIEALGGVRARHTSAINSGTGGAPLSFSDSTPTDIAVIQPFNFDGTNYGFKFRAFTSGGLADIMAVVGNGNVGIGTNFPSYFGGYKTLHIYGSQGALSLWEEGGGVIGQANASGGSTFVVGTRSNHPLILGTSGVERARFDTASNFLVGVPSGSSHVIARGSAQGDLVVNVSGLAQGSAQFYSAANSGYSGAAAAMKVNANSGTGRSANFAGTVNASGGDACECFWKSVGCGTILKGDICGIDIDGKLTRTWTDAIAGFGFKTTNPHLVGRDTFHRKAGPEPIAPLYAAPVYDGPPAEPTAPGAAPLPLGPLDDRPEQPAQEDGEEVTDFIIRMARWVNAETAWITAADRRPADLEAVAKAFVAQELAAAQYARDLPIWEQAQTDHRAAVDAAEAEHAAAVAAYEAEHTAWQGRLTAAAKEVDRIATNGQVPVEFDGAFEVGQILVPVARGAGIGMKAVDVDAATDAEIRRSLGTIIKRLAEDDRDTIETSEIWGRSAVGKPWVFVQGLAPGRPK